jgi:MFS family permease
VGLNNHAMTFILLLGAISFLSDITYEGARSIQGQYLGVLGASGAVVGIVAGLGECIGYGFRLFSGRMSDKTGRYWFFAALGYSMNFIAVPLLALAPSWQFAAVLLLLERFGKAIRTPPRDAMISYATDQVGRGRGFGIHEAIDRGGAVLGPLFIVFVLSFAHDYRAAFALLAIPAALSVYVLAITARSYSEPKGFATPQPPQTVSGYSRQFWQTVIALSLVGAGTVDFSLVGFHLQHSQGFAETSIPMIFAVSMAVNGASAYFVGRAYDVLGIPMFLTTLGLGLLATPCLFLGNGPVVLLGGCLLGVSMATQNSIGKALIADLVPLDKRSSAYGVYYISFGVLWFLGSAIIGVLYDATLPVMILFSVITQAAALPILARVCKD